MFHTFCPRIPFSSSLVGTGPYVILWHSIPLFPLPNKRGFPWHNSHGSKTFTCHDNKRHNWEILCSRSSWWWLDPCIILNQNGSSRESNHSSSYFFLAKGEPYCFHYLGCHGLWGRGWRRQKGRYGWQWLQDVLDGADRDQHMGSILM